MDVAAVHVDVEVAFALQLHEPGGGSLGGRAARVAREHAVDVESIRGIEGGNAGAHGARIDASDNRHGAPHGPGPACEFDCKPPCGFDADELAAVDARRDEHAGSLVRPPDDGDGQCLARHLDFGEDAHDGFFFI